MIADTRDEQRAAIDRKIQVHRQWLVTATAGGGTLTSPEYAKCRAELTAIQAEQRRLGPTT
jgi:hypothetical protein